MTMYHCCFECGNARYSLKEGKKLQRFLLDRVAKFTSLYLEQGQGFISAESYGCIEQL